MIVTVIIVIIIIEKSDQKLVTSSYKHTKYIDYIMICDNYTV